MNKHRVTPLLMAISLVLGVVIGTFYASHYSVFLYHKRELLEMCCKFCI